MKLSSPNLNKNHQYLNRVLLLIMSLILLLIVSLVIDHTLRKSSTLQECAAVISNDLSFVDVTCMSFDHQNRLWIGTTSGLNRKEGDEYIHYLHNPEDSLHTILSNNINSIFTDRNDQIWVSTDKGLSFYKEGFGFKSFRFPTDLNITQTIQLSSGEIVGTNGFDIYQPKGDSLIAIASIKTQDKRGNVAKKISADLHGGLWWISVTGLGHLNRDMKLISLHQTTGDARICNISDGKDYLWFSQDKNLFCLDKKKEKIIPKHLPVDDNIENLAASGNSLIAKTFRHGYFRHYSYSDTLESITFNNPNIDIEKYQQKSMTFTNKGNLILAMKDYGLELISKYQMELGAINNNPLCKVCQGYCIGSTVEMGKAIYAVSGNEILKYDTEKKDVKKYTQDNIFPNTPHFRHDIAKLVPLTNGSMVLMSNSRLVIVQFTEHGILIKQNFYLEQRLCDCITKGEAFYVLTKSGNLYRYTFGQEQMQLLASNLFEGSISAKMLPLTEDKILVMSKIKEAVIIDSEGKREYLSIDGEGLLSYDEVSSLSADKQGKIYVGTLYGGLYSLDYQTHTLKKILSSRKNEPITNICALDAHRMLFTDRHDLFVFQIDSLLIHRINTSNITDIKDYRILENAVTVLSKDRILMGTSKGCIFVPLKTEMHTAVLGVDEIMLIGNKELSYVRKKEVESGNVIFSGNDQDVTLHIAGFHDEGTMASQAGVYKLEGYDREWRPLQGSRVSYVNLPSGKYDFQLKQAGSERQTKTLHIRLLPPIWVSWQALLIYMLLFLAVLLIITTLQLAHSKDRLELQAKENENERERASNEMNKRFFANISHEFRNPLTMIAGPVIQLQRDTTLPTRVRQSMSVVGKSVSRMLGLIDQILDFNKLDEGDLRLQVEITDLSNQLRQQTEVFREAVGYRNIKVSLIGTEEPLPLWIDRDKLDKVMGNLMSNAMKHTPDKGRIDINLEKKKDTVNISIKNSGSYIPEEKLSDVFKRYYQIRETNARSDISLGTGIGLYYVSQLVRLHHGTIGVRNLEDGVEFTFTLPAKDVYSAQDKLVVSKQTNVSSPFDMRAPSSATNPVVALDASAPTMVIIDDDTELSLYIRSIFTDKFKVKNMYSAEEALEYLQDNEPDIILSDIMMGEMSGLDLCRKLKSDANYSHIPIILISGKNEIREQIEGLKVGAIAYIVKPFDPDMLQTLVDSQINNMNEVRKLLTKGTSTHNVADKLSLQDQKFINALYEIMEEDIMNSEINVEEISRRVGVSRTKLFYKMKKLTGTTPAAFFRTFKLNKAAEMLREGKYIVSEVAMRTGFDNVSYFSTAFKKQFGVAPSDY